MTFDGQFRRLDALPPYVFAEINGLKTQLRRAGEDVIDLAFGNPDLPSPQVAVDKLTEAAQNPRNHRYSMSQGLPKLRLAAAELYERTFGVTVDFETEVCATIGAKEGFSHLMLTLVGPGDTALVPAPSYPIHIWGPIIAGAAVHYVRLGPDQDFFANLEDSYLQAWPRPRVLVVSFPHNPTTMCVDLAFMARLVAWAKEHSVVVVHDFAYADLGFDHQPPSILQVPGAKDVAVEIYSLTKSFSMAGWRMGFLVGNAAIVNALYRLKSYLDYGTFQPIQIAATVAMNEVPDFPREVNAIYKSRRDALADGLNRIGWHVERPRGTMFLWAPIPEPYREMSSVEFAMMLVQDAKVAVSPGAGFGPGGEGFVRFALVENEQRITQAIRGMRKALTKLG
jgi:alanine-synthesizing transaminase